MGMKCHFCGKDLDPKNYIVVESAGDKEEKRFCPGPIGVGSYPIMAEPDLVERARIAQNGLCSQVYKLQQLKEGKATFTQLVSK